MEIDDLPDPADLWWSWVFLAALHRAAHDTACGYDERHGVLHLDAADGSWLRMQRVLRLRPCWCRQACDCLPQYVQSFAGFRRARRHRS